ncbi:hypothetical protein PBI_COLTRANE_47 [Microbacterium phage Coltrane]|uniref:Uncharacterized protein n=4 Tax=Armstrongvirus armstrong TaxID=2734217 RepID=A0A3G2KDD4_9CAUD|nr:hypothetical protein PBI_BRAHMS_47 [Microbacterium phage Brahms]AYN57024.1 hypothetical protein PBI_BERNSTEIN_47 [Microbacterium phage Bernstein]AYN57383.1 hypothetical protein PBI_COLTRANE_47 [Microbacterium phage Coltrane]AYN58971.1 hypothetical protein PBI_ROLLINS_47 [Microbacterium phage Rollins]UGL62014.1 hypothetical protein SEA_SKYLORD_47 [Microbacterium phage Skylord]
MNNNNNRIEFDVDGFTVSALLHTSTPWVRNLTKTRIYVGGEESVDFTEAYALQKANAEAYGSPFYGKGEFPAEDKLFASLNRQVVKNQKAVVEELRMTSEELDDILAAAGKLTFSRTAGCGCGCSSGFVPQHMAYIENRAIESLFITKKAA